jgi:predicted HTH transcriptional regulator
MKSLVFVSSVQKELATERRALKDYIQGDALLGRFFEVFLFEDLPASDRRADTVYLEEVDRCDIYIGLFGNEYGYEDDKGLSPTEREFDRATAARKERLIFVKGDKDSARHPKMQALVRKAGGQLIRRRFSSVPELTALVYSSLVEYLVSAGTVHTRPFDAAACPDAATNDLSREKVRDFLARAQAERNYPLGPRTPTEKALAHLNLLDRGRPSHAAVLLFGKQPQRFLITSEVKCLQFDGTTVAKPIPDYQIYKGTVFELVDQSVAFVMSKIAAAVGTRAESNRAPVTYEIPRAAVAEAIVNAVAHRDYASNASVQVMLFADRLEIWNPGQLPPSLTPETLRTPHASIPHNPLIAEPLFLTRYIEKAGTGILDMISLCEAAKLCSPEFRQEGGQFIQTLWRPKGAKAGPSGAQVEAQEAQVEAQVELPGTDVALLKTCQQKPRTAQELLLAAGYAKRTGNFKRSMDRLLSTGFLEMTIPEKPKSRLQKYRITAKGRAWLASETKGGSQ